MEHNLLVWDGFKKGLLELGEVIFTGQIFKSALRFHLGQEYPAVELLRVRPPCDFAYSLTGQTVYILNNVG